MNDYMDEKVTMKQKKWCGLISLALLGVMSVVNFAGAWPVPDTGQTDSYAVGDDGSYSINPRSYTDNGDGTVTDNVTKLMWQKQDEKKMISWENSNGYCEALTLGGYSDWRMPSAHELESLVDYSVPDTATSPTLDLMVFPGTQAWAYWSSSSSVDDTAFAWVVDFFPKSAVKVYTGLKTDSHYFVRCVRGEQAVWPFGHLAINNQDTTTDVSTGLSWQRQDDSMVRIWDDALDYCEGLTLDGFSDWRLPTIIELQSLVDFNLFDPSIDKTAFPNAKSEDYWSSTTIAGVSSRAWFVNYYGGNTTNYLKDVSTNYVRCVRGGPVNLPINSLEVLSPSQASVAVPGTIHTIAWNTADWIGQVEISLSRNGGKTWEIVNSGTENDGVHEWSVTGPDSYNCMLKIVPLAAPDLAAYNGLFSIVSDAASITTTTTSTTNASTTTTTIPGNEEITLNVLSGWSLLSSTVGVQAPSVFGDSLKFTSVWKWTDDGKGGKTWAVYLSGGDGGVSYANSKGFMPLTSIETGEGFWVNANTDEQLQISGTPSYGELSFTTGWNLVGVMGQSSMAVADLGDVTSVWKWTTVNGAKTWAVNLPGSEDKGASYAASKGFGTFNTLEPGEGFWVNKP